MSPKTAANFMRIMALISIFSGVIFAIGVISDTAGINSAFLNIVSSGNAGLGGIATQEAKVSLAIAGGVFAGFGAMLLFIVAPAIAQGDDRIKRGAIYALLIWFVVDSGASIAGGNAMNAVSNSLFLALYLLPLLWVSQRSASQQS